MIHRLTFLLVVVSFMLPHASLHAQATQSLSVTPPLFQLSVKPGDIWQSSIRVVNTNNYPLTVYAEVVNFAPEGEGGQGRFVPLIYNDETRATLAEWIEVSPGPYVVDEGRSREVQFFVDVPEDAAPGGHFAAILISTEPPAASGEDLALVTTQTVVALFFARIEGDIIEKAEIREFSVLDRSLELPEAEFSLRFENKGNVHIQPRGEILIMNMWGKERGVIPVNHDTHFGNVLPGSIRDFRFSWKGERSLADIGRYKAIATLAYGEDGIKNVTSTTYFWVIPVRGALITVAFLAAFIFAITWMIRLYIRRMLVLAGVDPDEEHRRHVARTLPTERTKIEPSVTAPLREGTLDLRSRIRDANETVDVFMTIVRFTVEYKRFFIALLVLISGFICLVYYAQEVSNTDTEFEITIDEGDSTRTLTDEDVEVRGEE
jgi:hypothetical protein